MSNPGIHNSFIETDDASGRVDGLCLSSSP
jgi:hypothetical protein